jgi:hypothetical protein
MNTDRPRATSRPPSSPTSHSLGLRLVLPPAARLPSEPAPRLYIAHPRSAEPTAKTIRPCAPRARRAGGAK